VDEWQHPARRKLAVVPGHFGSNCQHPSIVDAAEQGGGGRDTQPACAAKTWLKRREGVGVKEGLRILSSRSTIRGLLFEQAGQPVTHLITVGDVTESSSIEDALSDGSFCRQASIFPAPSRCWCRRRVGDCRECRRLHRGFSSGIGCRLRP